MEQGGEERAERIEWNNVSLVVDVAIVSVAIVSVAISRTLSLAHLSCWNRFVAEGLPLLLRD